MSDSSKCASDANADTCVPAEALADIPSVALNSAPQAAKVGDRLRLKFGESLPPDRSLKFVLPLGNTGLLEQGWMFGAIKAESPAGYSVELIPLMGGQLSLPTLAVVEGVGPESKVLARTEPLNLVVEKALKDQTEQPLSHVPPQSLPIPLLEAGVAGGLGLLILGLILWGIIKTYRRLRGWRGPEKVVPKGPLLLPHEVALNALRELQRKDGWKNGKHKAFYFSVSEILKIYLGERFGFDAQESTTYELFQRLEKLWSTEALPSIRLMELKNLFERLDRVKFTDFGPPDSECVQVVGDAIAAVLHIKKDPPVVTEAGAK